MRRLLVSRFGPLALFLAARGLAALALTRAQDAAFGAALGAATVALPSLAAFASLFAIPVVLTHKERTILRGYEFSAHSQMILNRTPFAGSRQVARQHPSCPGPSRWQIIGALVRRAG